MKPERFLFFARVAISVYKKIYCNMLNPILAFYLVDSFQEIIHFSQVWYTNKTCHKNYNISFNFFVIATNRTRLLREMTGHFLWLCFPIVFKFKNRQNLTLFFLISAQILLSAQAKTYFLNKHPGPLIIHLWYSNVSNFLMEPSLVDTSSRRHYIHMGVFFLSNFYFVMLIIILHLFVPIMAR